VKASMPNQRTGMVVAATKEGSRKKRGGGETGVARDLSSQKQKRGHKKTGARGRQYDI